ncbi:hypothetical protein JTE88_05790 [Arcanobacterium phocisimile]|uniref:Uncharacterized protein n=1 Tax=Arcanobacterium phocisimile TaxID=1302235 RepID=A0ABX7IGC7_9ACTO|nr:hypothetical protein [Arcanobacterium phocisimile]QRV01614.1 hypothetical protein JTE88_05790 [Arcanobacterium phocisimile]
MLVPHTGSIMSLVLISAIVQLGLIVVPLITLGAWYIHTPHRKLFFKRLPYAPKLQTTIRGLAIARIIGFIAGIPATIILLSFIRIPELSYAAPFTIYTSVCLFTLIVHIFTFKAAHDPGHSGLERRTLTQYVNHLPKVTLIGTPLILFILTALYPLIPVLPDDSGSVSYAPPLAAFAVIGALMFTSLLTVALTQIVVLRPRNSSNSELVSLDNIVRRRSINELIFGLTAATSATALGLSVRGAHHAFGALFLRPTVFINTGAMPSSTILIILATVHTIAAIINIAIFIIALARQFNPGIGVDR